MEQNLGWIIPVIAIVVVLLLYMVIPWEKLAKGKKAKDDLKNTPSKYIDKPESILEQRKTNIEDPMNKPMLGIYNWFGKKEALRLKTLVYVQPEEDSCALCRPFENMVLSLEMYDNRYITMHEAISKGYHHIGCKHIDIDYFPGNTIIPENPYSIELQEAKHNLVLQQYRKEQEIRNIKYKQDNEKVDSSLEVKLKELEKDLTDFCNKNGLQRNIERENPYISDYQKFK